MISDSEILLQQSSVTGRRRQSAEGRNRDQFRFRIQIQSIRGSLPLIPYKPKPETV